MPTSTLVTVLTKHASHHHTIPLWSWDVACWVMKCWSSVMRMFTGRACCTWIKPSVWLRKYELCPVRSQPVRASSFFFSSFFFRKWEPNSCGMKRKHASGSPGLPQDPLKGEGLNSHGSFLWCGLVAGLGRWNCRNNNTHILSVLFISSTVECFPSSCWEKWRDPYFWTGQMTFSPLGRCSCI